MAKTLDELTVRWEEDGELQVEELDKRVLQEGGGWATLAFLSRDVSGDHSEPRVTIRRYRKRGGAWQVHAKLNLNGKEQALALRDALSDWLVTI